MRHRIMKNLRVRSKNFSCRKLKELIFPRTVIYRMGSTTPTQAITRVRRPIEINSPEACRISGDKILMKKRFNHARVRTAKWFTVTPGDSYGERFMYYLNKWETPIIVKHKHSSKGRGIYLLKTHEDYQTFWHEHHENIQNFVFERYYSYTKEYRIHVCQELGCFYTSRKVLLNEAQDRWHRHSNNSTFLNEDNPMFDKPENWDEIVEACLNALKALKLDIAAFDVKVSKQGKYIILESNSAPALGEQGLEKYKHAINTIVNGRLRI